MRRVADARPSLGQHMKHLIAVLVALLLPLQLSWAVAATYCQHEETVPAASHFGHHGHVHPGSTTGATTDAETEPAPEASPSGGQLIADLDCSFCHASAAAALPVLADLPAAARPPGAPLSTADTRLKSPPERTPDRPQWARLA